MKFLAKIGLFSLLGIAMSYAQPTTTEDAPPADPAKPAAAPAVQLTFPEMLAQSKSLHETILKDWQHCKHLQELARKEKDVIKLNCVNDKLVQIKPQMNIADRARSILEGSSEGDNRAALFDEVAQSADAIRKLREEADQCIGENTLGTEASSGYTAPDIPDNPFVDPFQDPVFEPPGYASPFN